VALGVVEKAKELLSSDPPAPITIPKPIEERMKRGRDAMKEGAPKRNECLAFARGEQYKWVDSKNTLQAQNTTNLIDGRGKPRHRIRQTRNFIFDIVENETASAVQKVPGYDVSPSSAEPKRETAASLSRKVALYGYDKWGLRRVTERVVRYAVIADEGFAWPYFDNTVGPYLPEDEEGKRIGQGEIKVRTFGPNEVFWEPGLPFEESRWLGIEQARDPQSVMEMEGYIGGKLEPNAQKAESDQVNSQDKLVLVTDYLERPSASNPEGQWLTMAGERVIVAKRPYPCLDGEGNVVDEPVLHKLTYSMDPENDRDSGLVRHLLDAQRTINYCNNKITEWAALAQNPQLLIVNGRLKQKLTDEGGAVYNVAGTGDIQWRPTPNTPGELFKQKEEAIADMGRIAAQNDIPNAVESGKGITALIEKDNARRSNFIENLAQFHSRLMRHCLYLVQRHYSEPRLLKVRGERGIQPIADFMGSELLGEVDVRVAPGSLEALTREAIEAKIMAFAERGWISPHAAMAAINSGTAENLVDSYERDVARANLIIQKIIEGPEVLFSTPERRPFFGEDPGIDEGTQLPREYIPGWMPRPFDDTKVLKDVFADWMKGTEYDDLPPESQEAANAVYDGILQLEAKQNAAAAEAQAQTAESLGMSNAAKPQTPPPLPDQAPLNS
jgi:hypothetical protein